MAEIVLGPMLRYVSATEATIWLELDSACEVEILGRRARTVHVAGDHYALVVLRGLEPGSTTAYEVRLDDETRWPDPASPYPPSLLRTHPAAGAGRILWGSCRVARPHHPPYTLDAEEHPEGVGVDALFALVERMRRQPPDEWADLMLLIGDQVYADEVSPVTLEAIRARRDIRQAPGEEVLDAEEYTLLYRESWSDPAIRWLFSTVPSAMMFDDHDVHDDWNTSESWVAEMRATDWWQERIVAALSTYWIYQHLGNLSPDELDRNELWGELQRVEDGEPTLRRFATAADRDEGGGLWAISRTLGSTRLVMLDGREGRVLSHGRREMMDEDEWRWLQDQVSGDFDHVLIAGTLPVLLAPTLHWIEAWNEALCAGAWGRWLIGPSESLRRGLDLEHWAAFQTSFHRLVGLITDLGAGRYGGAPRSIVLMGGDVHQGYLERVGFPPGSGVRSRVVQAVCSPFRNQLGARDRRVVGGMRRSQLMRRVMRWLARTAGVEEPRIGWRVLQRPSWRNQLGWLLIDGAHLEVLIETTPADHSATLAPSLHHRVS